MVKSKKVSCSYSSFIDRLQPGKNYSKYKMVSIGNSNETSLGYHSFRTLLSFNLENIDTSKILNVYLSLFIRKVETSGPTSNSIDLYIGKDFESYDSISWNSLDKVENSNILSINIPSHITNSLIKINITKLVKNHIFNGNILNLILCPGRYDEEYAVILSSVNSQNPPLIDLQLKDIDTENKNDSKPIENSTKARVDNNYSVLIKKLDTSENIIKNMQNSMNIILKRLSDQSEKSSLVYDSINSLSTSLNKVNKNLSELNKNMQLVLKQTSYDKPTNNNNLPLDKLAEINSKFDSVENSLDKLINLLSSFSIEPLN